MGKCSEKKIKEARREAEVEKRCRYRTDRSCDMIDSALGWRDQTDAALKLQQLQIERERIASQQQTDDKRIKVDAVKAAMGQGSSREEMMARLSVDVLKHLSNKHTEQTRPQPAKKGE